MDCVIVHRVAKSRTQLNNFHFNTSLKVSLLGIRLWPIFTSLMRLSFLKKITTSYSSFCSWKGRPFQGLRVGSCLTLGNKLSKEIHVNKARDFIGKGCPMKSQGYGNPEELLCRVAPSQVFRWWDCFLGCLWLIILIQVLPGGACVTQPRWVPARRILGGHMDLCLSVSFWPFLSSSSWWWLVSSVFLTGISCHKITQANGSCDTWPGWLVSVNGSPNISIS